MKSLLHLVLRSLRFELLACVALVFGLVACAEKKPEVNSARQGATTNNQNSGKDGTGTDDGSQGGTDSTGDGGGSAAFDLCKDKDGLLANSQLGDFQTFITELCNGSGDLALTNLRQTGNIYTGGDSKLLLPDVSANDTATHTTIKMATSTIVSTTPHDYYNLLMLQFTKPASFRGQSCANPLNPVPTPFLCDCNAQLKNVAQDGNVVSYRYINTGDNEGGSVDYEAKTTMITLKENQAYVAATKLTVSHDTMVDLNGLIIVNKKGDKTEVFTLSNQTYEHDSANGPALKDRAISALKAEQARAYKNGNVADQAAALLNGG